MKFVKRIVSLLLLMSYLALGATLFFKVGNDFFNVYSQIAFGSTLVLCLAASNFLHLVRMFIIKRMHKHYKKEAKQSKFAHLFPETL